MHSGIALSVKQTCSAGIELIEKHGILQRNIIMLLILLEQPLQLLCICKPLFFGPYLGDSDYDKQQKKRTNKAAI